MHGKAFLVGEGLSVKRQQGSYASTPCTIPNRNGTPGKAQSTINEYIENVFEEGELVPEEVVRKIGISEFSIESTDFYNLDVIISRRLRVRPTTKALAPGVSSSELHAIGLPS